MPFLCWDASVVSGYFPMNFARGGLFVYGIMAIIMLKYELIIKP